MMMTNDVVASCKLMKNAKDSDGGICMYVVRIKGETPLDPFTHDWYGLPKVKDPL